MYRLRFLFTAAPFTALALTAGMQANAMSDQRVDRSGGPLGLLKTGEYRCTLPGDAMGPASQRMPEMDFTIDNASTYHDANGRGTYLLVGPIVTFTRGPMKGARFTRMTSNTLRKLGDGGEPTPLLCTRAGPAAQPR